MSRWFLAVILAATSVRSEDCQSGSCVAKDNVMLQVGQGGIQRTSSQGQVPAALIDEKNAEEINGKLNLNIGSSPNHNKKCKKISAAVACHINAANRGQRVNKDRPNSQATFDVTMLQQGKEICVRRTDRNAGWHMNLKIHCTRVRRASQLNEENATLAEDARLQKQQTSLVEVSKGGDAGEEVDNAADDLTNKDTSLSKANGNLIINIGTSPSHNKKCKRISATVACHINAANRGQRVNQDRPKSQATFDVTMLQQGREICVRRTDRNAGWHMNLKIHCKRVRNANLNQLQEGDLEQLALAEKASDKSAAAGARIDVVIGKSDKNEKCKNLQHRVHCSTTAGNRHRRVNQDYKWARDAFHVSVRSGGTEVCTRRTDRPHGWGMHLIIRCNKL